MEELPAAAAEGEAATATRAVDVVDVGDTCESSRTGFGLEGQHGGRLALGESTGRAGDAADGGRDAAGTEVLLTGPGSPSRPS